MIYSKSLKVAIVQSYNLFEAFFHLSDLTAGMLINKIHALCYYPNSHVPFLCSVL